MGSARAPRSRRLADLAARPLAPNPQILPLPVPTVNRRSPRSGSGWPWASCDPNRSSTWSWPARTISAQDGSCPAHLVTPPALARPEVGYPERSLRSALVSTRPSRQCRSSRFLLPPRSRAPWRASSRAGPPRPACLTYLIQSNRSTRAPSRESSSLCSRSSSTPSREYRRYNPSRVPHLGTEPDLRRPCDTATLMTHNASM